MTTLLESRYRLALRLLPRSYRARWEDDMVATFMASAYATTPENPEGVEASRPRWSEVLSVAGLALRLRVGGVDAPARPRLRGEALRLITLSVFLAQASVYFSEGLVSVYYVYLWTPPLYVPDEGPTRLEIASMAVGALWVIAFVMLLFGRLRWARFLGLIAAAGNVVGVGLSAYSLGAVSPATWVWLGGSVVAVLAAFVIPPTAARSRPVPWLIVLAAMVVADVVVVARQASLDWVGVLCLAFLAVALWQRRSLAWNLAIAALGVGLIPLRVADVIQLASSPYYSGSIGLDWFVPLGFIAAGLVALVTGASSVRAWRHLRRLPGERPTEAPSPGLPSP